MATMSKRSLGHLAVPTSFEYDLSLLDRYHAFSAEIVRIFLLGLSEIGALIFKIVFVSNSQEAGLADGSPAGHAPPRVGR